MSSEIRISIIIISFNSVDLTRKCLLSLVTEIDTYQSEIIVVDNCSSDGSQAMIRSDFPNVHLMELDQNIGFGPANNRGAAAAQGEFLLLLNSDTVVHPGAIVGLLEFASQHPDAVAVGPRLLNGDGTLQKGCWRFPTLWRALGESMGVTRLFGRPSNYRTEEYELTHRVDFVIGACVLVRRASFERVGGFDERFFMYAEETDLFRRMSGPSSYIYYYPKNVITHLGGGSQATPPSRLSQFFGSQELYYQKHYGQAGLAAYKLIMVWRSLLRRFLCLVVSAVRPGLTPALTRSAETSRYILKRYLYPDRQSVRK